MGKLFLLLLMIWAIGGISVYAVYRYYLRSKEMNHEKQMKREERDYDVLLEDDDP